MRGKSGKRRMRRRWRRWALVWGAALAAIWAVFGMSGTPGERRVGEPVPAVAAVAPVGTVGKAGTAAGVPAVAALSAIPAASAGPAVSTGPAVSAGSAGSAGSAVSAGSAGSADVTDTAGTAVRAKDAVAASRPSVPVPDASRPVVYLTFDDGPSEHTARVLDILRDEGVAATFFVLGEQAERHPGLMRRIVREGHVLGNHTYNHRYEELYGDFRAFAGQLLRTEEAIERTAGVRTRLVRAPGGTYGNFDRSYFRALAEAGYLVFDWNVDSGDAKRRNVPASEIARNVTGAKLQDRMVVLLHDGAGHGETVKALPAVIAHFKRHGYAFGVLSERVEPVVFRVAPGLKWERKPVSAGAALAWLGGEQAAAVRAASAAQVDVGGAVNRAIPAIAEAHPSGRRAAVLAGMRYAGTREGSVIPPGIGGGMMSLAKQERFRTETDAYVPIRLWGERAGGVVRWEQRPGRATVALDGAVLQVTPGDGLLEIETASVRLAWKADVRLIDGTLYVEAGALRRTAAFLAADGPDTTVGPWRHRVGGPAGDDPVGSGFSG